MHRFIPATAQHLHFRVVEMPVNHRPRTCGQTKYGLGIWQRAIPGLLDCLAVRWMQRRRRPVHYVHHARSELDDAPSEIIIPEARARSLGSRR
jgi:hypothetical protein